jgi:hypothetical protein
VGVHAAAAEKAFVVLSLKWLEFEGGVISIREALAKFFLCRGHASRFMDLLCCNWP